MTAFEIIYFSIGVCLAPVTAAVLARSEEFRDELLDDLGGMILACLITAFAMATTVVLWGLGLAIGVIIGFGWLMLKAVEPGRLRLRFPRRRHLEDRIAELEAELGMRK